MTSNTRHPSPKMYPVDWMVLGYCLLMVVVIAILGRPLGEYLGEIAFFAAMGVLALVIVRYVDDTSGRRQAFVRLLYPALMMTFFYRATGGLMFLLFDRFLDYQVVAWEQSLLGTEPTLFIDAHLLNGPATEILSLCYFSYYLMLPVFLIALFMRHDYRIMREFLAAASLTFFVSYSLFWLYPAEGPRWYLAGQYLNQIDGLVFRPMVEFVIDNAAVHGGAMPSSHTGVALVVMLFCFRYYRKVGWWLLPVVTGLAAGAVWGRFHYLSDVLIGALIGVVAFRLVCRNPFGRVEQPSVTDPREVLRTQDVS